MLSINNNYYFLDLDEGNHLILLPAWFMPMMCKRKRKKCFLPYEIIKSVHWPFFSNRSIVISNRKRVLTMESRDGFVEKIYDWSNTFICISYTHFINVAVFAVGRCFSCCITFVESKSVQNSSPVVFIGEIPLFVDNYKTVGKEKLVVTFFKFAFVERMYFFLLHVNYFRPHGVFLFVNNFSYNEQVRQFLAIYLALCEK